MPLRSCCFVCRRAHMRSEVRAISRGAPMPRKADRVREGDKVLRGPTRICAEIRICSVRLCRSMAAGVRLRIIPLTAGSMRQAIVRRIRGFVPAIAIPVLRSLRGIWPTG